jgi:cytochrome c551/c552
MNIFSLTSVPQSLQTLHLLEFLLFIGTSIFLGYLTTFLGSYIFSLYFSIKSKKDIELRKLSKLFIIPFSNSYLTHLGLGIFPFIAILFIFNQFVKPENASTINLFELSLIIFTITTFLSYFHKKIINKTEQINMPIVITTIIALFISLWLFSSGFVYNLQPKNIITNSSLIGLLFTISNISFLILLLLFSLAIASINFLFFSKYSEDYKMKDENEELKFTSYFKTILNFFSYSSMSLPIIFFLFMLTINRNEITFNFFLIILSLLLLVLTVRLSIIYRTNSKTSYIRLSYIFFIFFLMGIIGLNTDAFSNSSKATILTTAQKYEEHKTEIASNEEPKNNVNKIGEDIFFAKCTNCHREDSKFVGPAIKDFLAKYKDKKAEMIKFVLNPTKVDKKYPAMPNQGLKQIEAEAVVNYIFQEYSKK